MIVTAAALALALSSCRIQSVGYVPENKLGDIYEDYIYFEKLVVGRNYCIMVTHVAEKWIAADKEGRAALQETFFQGCHVSLEGGHFAVVDPATGFSLNVYETDKDIATNGWIVGWGGGDREDDGAYRVRKGSDGYFVIDSRDRFPLENVSFMEIDGKFETHTVLDDVSNYRYTVDCEDFRMDFSIGSNIMGINYSVNADLKFLYGGEKNEAVLKVSGFYTDITYNGITETFVRYVIKSDESGSTVFSVTEA